MALTSVPVPIIKRRWVCLSSMKRIWLMEGISGEVVAIALWWDGSPPRNRVAGVSTEVGVVEGQIIGGCNVAGSAQ